jgi:hypothetical protein
VPAAGSGGRLGIAFAGEPIVFFLAILVKIHIIFS